MSGPRGCAGTWSRSPTPSRGWPPAWRRAPRRSGRRAPDVAWYAAGVGDLEGPPVEPWGPADFAELLRVRTGTTLDPAGLLARGRAEADRQLHGPRAAAARRRRAP